jgi:hypothetical protein
MKEIRIHPAGVGHSTNHELARSLEQATPRSYRKAQDVLVAAKHYVAGPRLFRSRKSLIQRLQKEIYELKDAILDERSEDRGNSHVEILFAYLSIVSEAHPNWQREYTALNKFIPMCF